METLQDIAASIDWSKAPAWADFVAADYYDKTGVLAWYWFAERPLPTAEGTWWPGDESMSFRFESYRRETVPTKPAFPLMFERPCSLPNQCQALPINWSEAPAWARFAAAEGYLGDTIDWYWFAQPPVLHSGALGLDLMWSIRHSFEQGRVLYRVTPRPENFSVAKFLFAKPTC